MSHHDLEKCPVCFDDLVLDDTRRQFTRTCGHSLHVGCAFHLVQALGRTTCSVCTRPWSDDDENRYRQAVESGANSSFSTVRSESPVANDHMFDGQEIVDFGSLAPGWLVPLCCNRTCMGDGELATTLSDRRMTWLWSKSPSGTTSEYICYSCGKALSLTLLQMCMRRFTSRPLVCCGYCDAHGFRQYLVDTHTLSVSEICAMQADENEVPWYHECCHYSLIGNLHSLDPMAMVEAEPIEITDIEGAHDDVPDTMILENMDVHPATTEYAAIRADVIHELQADNSIPETYNDQVDADRAMAMVDDIAHQISSNPEPYVLEAAQIDGDACAQTYVVAAAHVHEQTDSVEAAECDAPRHEQADEKDSDKTSTTAECNSPPKLQHVEMPANDRVHSPALSAEEASHDFEDECNTYWQMRGHAVGTCDGRCVRQRTSNFPVILPTMSSEDVRVNLAALVFRHKCEEELHTIRRLCNAAHGA